MHYHTPLQDNLPNPQRRRKVGQHDASPIQVTVIYYNGYFFICKRFDINRQNNTKFDIRFICKSKFNETLRDDLKSDIIIRNNNLSNEDSDFVKVLDFNSNQDFFCFL